MNLYKFENKRTGEIEIGNKEHWRAWAEIFYSNLCYDEEQRHTKKDLSLMPSDWWERVQKVLKLEQL